LPEVIKHARHLEYLAFDQAAVGVIRAWPPKY